MSAMGQFFIFWLVRSFSALTLVTVTTTRKFFTVLVSRPLLLPFLLPFLLSRVPL